MNKSEYKKIENIGNDDSSNRGKIDDFYADLEKPSTCTKKSATKKKKKKSDHKHQFEEVLLQVSYRYPLTGKVTKNLHLGKRCSICSMIKETSWFITEKCSDGSSRILTYDEIINKYPDLEIVDYC
jgi:hypothetical protein